jgi:hypothetical protein
MYPSRARLLIASAWILSAILNIPMVLSVFVEHKLHSEYAAFADQVLTIVFSASACVFLVFAYVRILKVVRSHRQDIEKHETQLATNSHSLESVLSPSSSSCPIERIRRKNKDGTITATGFVTLIFLVCNGFWQYFLLYRMWPDTIPITYPVIFLTKLLLYCSSTMNFVVFALLRKDLREELESYLKKFYTKLAPERTKASS